MRYPQLVPDWVCKIPAVVTFDPEGLNEYGEPLPQIRKELKVNYEDGAQTVYTDDKKEIRISGKAYMPGDACPQLPVITTGDITLFGVRRRIAYGRKARNPDGTVNFTELGVI